MTTGTADLFGATLLLRSHGLRVTPQRQLLVQVASNMAGHFTAEMVHEQIRERYPNVSIVSVYRGLETLRETGLVSCTKLGDHASRYEWMTTPGHHHLICAQCGYQQDLPDVEMDALRERLRARFGFEARIDHHAIWGLCRHCAAEV